MEEASACQIGSLDRHNLRKMRDCTFIQVIYVAGDLKAVLSSLMLSTRFAFIIWEWELSDGRRGKKDD